MSFVDIFNTDKKYSIIYADPPWRYADKKCNGGAEKHYPTMSINDICNLPVKNIANKDAILFMWVTYPMLSEGLKVIDKWGFKYKTIGFQWVKTNRKDRNSFFFGLGRWTRGNTECCLIATRGKPKRISTNVGQLIVEPLTRHSEKPDIVRDKIVQLMGDLPRIELFARTTKEHWHCWGNDENLSAI
ncbi:DNA methyltransferase [[Pasteurella] aerogenes]|nr:DNA methyltransferase [[Pasteurella] aerogenes]